MSNEIQTTIINNDKESNMEYSKEDLQILKFLKMVDENNNVDKISKPTPLHVSTRSAKCKLTEKIDMDKAVIILKDIIENHQSETIVGLEYKNISVGEVKRKKKKQGENGEKKQKFYNQATIIIKPKPGGKNINVKFFLNGSTSMTGCQGENDGIMVMLNFIKEMKKYPEVFNDEKHRQSLDVVDYKVTMINADYSVGFKIDRAKLYQLLVENYKVYVFYNPSIYQGVKISYMWNDNNLFKDGVCQCQNKCRLEKNVRKKNSCKIVTISIFQSGNIIITGSSNIEQTMEAYEFINKILYDNYSLVVRFSILDCNSDSEDNNNFNEL